MTVQRFNNLKLTTAVHTARAAEHVGERVVRGGEPHQPGGDGDELAGHDGGE